MPSWTACRAVHLERGRGHEADEQCHQGKCGASTYEDWHRKAWAAAFVLLMITLVPNFGVRLMAGEPGLQTG